MVGIIPGLSSALSVISVNYGFFRSTANNMANSQTNGFRSERARSETLSPAGESFNGLVDGEAVSYLQSLDAPGDLSAGGT